MATRLDSDHDFWVWADGAGGLESGSPGQSSNAIAPVDGELIGCVWSVEVTGSGTLGADAVIELFINDVSFGTVFTIPSATAQFGGGTEIFTTRQDIREGDVIHIESDGGPSNVSVYSMAFLILKSSAKLFTLGDIALMPSTDSLTLSLGGDVSKPLCVPVDGTLEALVCNVLTNDLDADAVLTIEINELSGGPVFVTVPNGQIKNTGFVLRPPAAVDVQAGDYLRLKTDGGPTALAQMIHTFLLRPRAAPLPSSYVFITSDQMGAVQTVDDPCQTKPCPFTGELVEVIAVFDQALDAITTFDLRLGEVTPVYDSLFTTRSTLAAFESVRMTPSEKIYVSAGQGLMLRSNGEPTGGTVGHFTFVIRP